MCIWFWSLLLPFLIWQAACTPHSLYIVSKTVYTCHIFKRDQLYFHSSPMSFSLDHPEYNRSSSGNQTQHVHRGRSPFCYGNKHVDRMNSLTYQLQKILKFTIKFFETSRRRIYQRCRTPTTFSTCRYANTTHIKYPWYFSFSVTHLFLKC